jgi:hypothetical protein
MLLNAPPHVRAARPSATRPFGSSASGTFSLADARENVVNNERYLQFLLHDLRVRHVVWRTDKRLSEVMDW